MTDSIHKKLEIIGTSSKSVEDAISKAVAKASSTVRQLEWFEVTEIRGRVTGNQIDQYQVGLKVGFKLEED